MSAEVGRHSWADVLDPSGFVMPFGLRAFSPVTGGRLRTFQEYEAALLAPRHMAASLVSWGRRTLWVSTVHLVSDMDFDRYDDEDEANRDPLVFETMVFAHSGHTTWPGVVEGMFDRQLRWRAGEDVVARHDTVVSIVVSELVALGHTVVHRRDPDVQLIGSAG